MRTLGLIFPSAGAELPAGIGELLRIGLLAHRAWHVVLPWPRVRGVDVLLRRQRVAVRGAKGVRGWCVELPVHSLRVVHWPGGVRPILVRHHVLRDKHLPASNLWPLSGSEAI